MNFWFSLGLVIAFANFVHIKSKKHDVEDYNEGLIPMDNYDVKPSRKTSSQNARTHKNLKVPMNSGARTLKPSTVQLTGEYYWELIYHIDNTNQDNPYKETRTIKKETTTSYSDLQENVAENIDKYAVSAELGGVFDVISVSVKGSMDMELTRSYKSTVEKKSETHVVEKIVREFNVGANSVGEMYRLVYVGPGVTYESGTVSTDSNRPLKEVIIDCKVRQVYMIENIVVSFTDESVDRPDNIITETNGLSPDVNDGFTGMYVWLQPVWTLDKDKAATKIQVVVQHQHNGNFDDLAASSGGVYRYLKLMRDPYELTRISRIGLLRSKTDVYDKIHEYHWDECTENINSGRGGTFLYLCWNNIKV